MSEYIEGIEDFLAKLDRMAYAVQRDVLIKAVKEGAEVIRAEAELRAPVGYTGRLSDQEITKVIESAADEVIAKIGPTSDAFYGIFVELGTAFMAAEPFLGPAFEAKKDEALAIASKYFKEALEKLA